MPSDPVAAEEMNPLRVGVALLPQLLPTGWSDTQAVAIVIDTLRFTSTACVALSGGAASIAVMSDIDAARRVASSTEPPMLLCGERHCVRIPGFDLGNSPLEYTPERIAGRRLIFSTTNGTVAVEATRAAQTTVLASLLNRQRVVQWLSAAPGSIAWIVCAGTDGQVAQEDVLTAGAIIDGLSSPVAGCRSSTIRRTWPGMPGAMCSARGA